MQKGGPLKILTLVREGPEKITTDFPFKIEFICFSTALTRNFHGKKGGPDFFSFAVWRGGGAKNFRDKYFLHQPPLTSVCERSLSRPIPSGEGTQLFSGGCVPRGFQNVGFRDRIFLEKFGSREIEFWPNHGWKCENFLKHENGRHKSGALTVNW